MTGPCSHVSGRRGILFDLDGVLWDSSPIHAEAFVEVSVLHGLEPVPYERLAGRPTTAAWCLVLEANGRSTSDADFVRALAREKQERARQRLREHPPLSDDVAYLASLSHADVLYGLVTGASAATAAIFIEAAGLKFEAVVTGDSGAVGKPSPEPYLRAVSQLGLESDECWVLEDSIQGIESALLAGTHCVHLTRESSRCTETHPPVESCETSVRDFLMKAGVAA